MSTIKTGTTLTTAFSVEGDTTGTFVVQTGSTPTTAISVDTSQNVAVTGSLTFNNGIEPASTGKAIAMSIVFG